MPTKRTRKLLPSRVEDHDENKDKDKDKDKGQAKSAPRVKGPDKAEYNKYDPLNTCYIRVKANK